MKSITFVILSYNKPELLELCLGSLRRDWQYFKTLYGRLDVVVVDNRSRMTPKILKLLSDYDKEKFVSKIIINDENVSFSRGINIGLKLVETEYVCLINDDIEFPNGEWLPELMKHYNTERVISVSPVSIIDQKNVYYSGIKKFDEHHKDRLDKTGKERWTPWNNMAVLITRMEMFRKYGFLRMDGKYKFYHSDEEWGRRLTKATNLIHIVVPTVVFHHHNKLSHRRV